MSTDTSRYLETAFNTYPQLPGFASTIFDYPQAKYEYAILIVGWSLGLALCRGRVRLLPLVATVAFAVQLIFAAFFLLADVRWVLPAPTYYQLVFTGWYMVGAGIGYGALLSGALRVFSSAAQRVFSTYWKGWLSSKSELLPAARVLGSLVCLSFVPAYLAVTWANVDELRILMGYWSPDQEMVAFLAERLSLVPDLHFRGSAVITFDDYKGSLTQDLLLRAYIPTLNDYNDLVTEQMFVMLHELLVKGDTRRVANRLPLFVLGAPGWAASYVKVTSALGARFILSRQPVDFSTALPVGTTGLKEVQFPGWAPEIWHVYELPQINTGNYSPTVLYKFATAAEMLDKMASPDFDFRTDAVVTEDVPGALVPLEDMRLSFERNAARVQGTSDGTSLALLPLQYSHCLRLSDPNARLVRADLMMVGIVFNGSLDARITDGFGMFTPGCRAADNADIRQMKIAIPKTAQPSGVDARPTAIRTAGDLLPNIMKILHQVQ